MKYINQLRKIFLTPSSQLFNNNKIMQNMKKQTNKEDISKLLNSLENVVKDDVEGIIAKYRN